MTLAARRAVLLLGLLALGVGLDQWTKVWADRNLGTPDHPVPVTIQPGEAGQPLGQVLQGRLGLDAAGVDQVFDRGPGGIGVLDTTLRPRPQDPAFRIVDGQPRLTWYWAFHHRTLDMPPRRLPQVQNAKRDLEELGRATVVDYLEKALPYLDDDARAEIIAGYLFPVVNRPLSPSRPVQAGETYLVMHRPTPLIDGFLQLKYAENPGAAWGFLAGQHETFRKWFFLLVSLLAITLISVLYHRLAPDQTMAAAGFAIILSGAIGNFIDRLRFNYVIDFIDMYAGDSHWPTYNIADVAISVGVGLLLLEALVIKNRAFLATSTRKAA